MYNQANTSLVGNFVFNNYQFGKEDQSFVKAHFDTQYSKSFTEVVYQVRNTFNECRNDTTSVSWAVEIRQTEMSSGLVTMQHEMLEACLEDKVVDGRAPVIAKAMIVTTMKKDSNDLLNASEAAMVLNKSVQEGAFDTYIVNQVKNLIMATSSRCKYLIREMDDDNKKKALCVLLYSNSSSEAVMVMLHQ